MRPHTENTRMYFEIQKEWEIESPFDQLFEGPEKRRFPLVELSHNFNVFIVDAEIKEDENCTFVNRFMFGSIHDTLMFINQEIFKSICISLLSRRCDNNGEYSVSDIIEIIEAKDEAGQISHIYCCKNGKRYIDSALANSEEELTSFKTVYYKYITNKD